MEVRNRADSEALVAKREDCSVEKEAEVAQPLVRGELCPLYRAANQTGEKARGEEPLAEVFVLEHRRSVFLQREGLSTGEGEGVGVEVRLTDRIKMRPRARAE